LGEVRLMQIIIKFVMYICINVDSPGAWSKHKIH
jgi:hypothetical protein